MPRQRRPRRDDFGAPPVSSGYGNDSAYAGAGGTINPAADPNPTSNWGAPAPPVSSGGGDSWGAAAPTQSSNGGGWNSGPANGAALGFEAQPQASSGWNAGGQTPKQSSVGLAPAASSGWNSGGGASTNGDIRYAATNGTTHSTGGLNFGILSNKAPSVGTPTKPTFAAAAPMASSSGASGAAITAATALVGASANSSGQLAHTAGLGQIVGGDKLLLNTGAPFSAIVVGEPESAKASAMSVLLESMIMYDPTIGVRVSDGAGSG